jgi:tungstate transport system substrate-binding protein
MRHPRLTPVRLVSLAAAIGAAVLTSVGVVGAGPASAASSTVTIVGTSDVSDSGLIVSGPDPSPLVAAFQAKYPQYTLNYVGKGTGAAIAYAEQGSADGLVVHAESLENQFVAAGYSNEAAGRAMFYGDFVLLGDLANDPADANVAANHPHDIVGAFADIATAGAAGTADFVSRGGTPGTTVEEHQIWGYLVDGTGDSTVPGLTLCQVSAANGGGYSPSTTSGACPDTITYPSWYHATGLTQGPNITNGDVCNYTNASSVGHNDCYVFTDRGTYDYLQSQSELTSLGIVMRDNAASAPGGATLLTNYFHGYVLNPNADYGGAHPDLNVAGATAFLDFVTSPPGQAVVGQYLEGAGDPRQVFSPDAAPDLTAGSLPAVANTGIKQRLAGHLVNRAPATPPLAGAVVRLVVSHGGANRTVASATVNSKGAYSIVFRPAESGRYLVESPRLPHRLEDAALSPQFFDSLQPTSSFLGRMVVVGRPRVSAHSVSGGILTVNGIVAPEAQTTAGKVTLLVRGPGGSRFHAVASRPVKPRVATYEISAALPHAGRWSYRVRWAIAGQIRAGLTSVHHAATP